MSEGVGVFKESPYRWLVCAITIMLPFCAIGLPSGAFQVYMPFLRDTYHFTNTQTSFMTTVRMGAAFVSMFGVPLWYKTLDIRWGCSLSCATCAIGYAIMAFAGPNYSLYIIANCFTGIAYGFAGSVAVGMVIRRWFVKDRGTAVGICMAGSGLSSVVVPPLATYWVQHFGLSFAFLWTAAFVIGACALFVLIVHNNPPKPQGMAETSAKAQDTKKAAAPDIVDDNKTIGGLNLWLMIAGIGLLGAVAVVGFQHLTILYVTEGWKPKVVATVISAAGATLMFTKVIYGWLTDKFSVFKVGWFAFTCFTLGSIIFCFAAYKDPIWLPYVGAILSRLGSPMCTVGIPLWAMDLSSAKDYPNTLRKFQQSYIFGGLLFATVPGIIADMTGSYIPYYVMCIGFLLFSCAVIQFSYIKMGKTASKKVKKAA